MAGDEVRMSVIGLRVGPFEILEPASVPEEGAWYRARRTGLTRRQPAEVLLCLVPPDAPPDQRAALQRRFDALRQLDDPRIPEAIAYYEGTGALAIAASEGHPFADLVDARRADAIEMSPATLLDLALEIAECLQRVHHRGHLHGHLSADRVVLGLDGRVWIWGFGLGPHHPAEPRWCPPERARGEPPGPATDQWSLGALVAGLATGRVPWDGDDPLAQARAADIDGLVDPVERQWPALGRALRRMLDPRPGNRFPSMNPVRQELLALARKAPGTSSRRELASSLVHADFVETSPFAPERDEEPVEVLVIAEPTDPEPESEQEPEPAGTPTPRPDPRPRRPDAAAEPEMAVLRDTPEEPIRRAAPSLPEEPIPVVRPKLRGDVPVARRSSDEADALRAPSGGPREPAALRAPPPAPPSPPDAASDDRPGVGATEEPRTAAEPEAEARAAAPSGNGEPGPSAEPPAAEPPAAEAGEAAPPDEAPVDAVDGPAAGPPAAAEVPSEPGATPTLAPATDADEEPEPGTDGDFTVAPLELEDEPAFDARPSAPPDASPSVAVRVAPLLVGAMALSMLIWLLVRVF